MLWLHTKSMKKTEIYWTNMELHVHVCAVTQDISQYFQVIKYFQPSMYSSYLLLRCTCTVFQSVTYAIEMLMNTSSDWHSFMAYLNEHFQPIHMLKMQSEKPTQ